MPSENLPPTDTLETPDFVEMGMIPEELADEWANIPKPQRVMIRRQMVSDKKLDWCIERLINGHETIAQLKRDVQTLNKIKEVMFAKWSIVAALFTAIVIPAALVWYGNHLANTARGEDTKALNSILSQLAEQNREAMRLKPPGS